MSDTISKILANTPLSVQSLIFQESDRKSSILDIIIIKKEVI